MLPKCCVSPTSLWKVLFAFQLCVRFAQGWQTACSTFNVQSLPEVALSATTYYPSNATVNITNLFETIYVDNLPGFCRVELVITTNSTANSSCNTEVWLPDDWNGRYLAFGNGGFAGGVAVAELGMIGVAQGFAGVSTDTGHTSTEGSGTWAGPYDDNAIIDWGWRAMHLSVATGKAVVEQYYGKAQNKSYYMGCSTGNYDRPYQYITMF